MATRSEARERALAAELCAAYREWAPLEPTAPRVSEMFAGGYSNSTFLLKGDSNDYVLRIASRVSAPGVERERECQLARAAAQRALAPEVLFCEPQRGLLITRYVRGDTPGDADVAQMAELLRRIHQLPPIGAAMSSDRQLVRYTALLERESATLALLRKHERTLSATRRRVAETPVSPATCHNDLLRANCKRAGDRLIALDWEYAAPGDVFFDLAVCASDMDDPATAASLLSHYLQRDPGEEERSRFMAQDLIYRAIASCWFELYWPASDIADRALQRLQDSLLAADSWHH